jgi:hypothetical protein
MNRRDILKALAAMPVTSALGRRREENEPTSPAPSATRVRTVQVLLEGAFAVVLHKNNPNRLTAFVPRAESGHDELVHDFFFNDPSKPKPAVTKDPAGYHFELSTTGLRTYPETYINPGFSDFLADTEKWTLPARVATIILPFPNSINFGGRPLGVTFASHKRGMMPTNHILEYYVDAPEKVKMSCTALGGQCEPSPHCPPEVLRFFFGVTPQMKDEDGQRKHAVDFFNFMLRKCFPELVGRYSVAEIDPSEERKSQTPGKARPTSSLQARSDLYMPAVIGVGEQRARLVPVSETVDCQTGGIIVRTNTGPQG